MTTFTDQEYLALIKSISEHQYEDPEEPAIPETAWIPAESEIKQKMLRQVTGNAVADLLKADKNRIRYAITQYNILQVGKFTIRITGHNEELCASLTQVTFNFTVYHQVNKTPSGAPANLTVPFNIDKDTRFTGLAWLNYFEKEHANVVPLEVLVDIVRFFQVAQTLTCFL